MFGHSAGQLIFERVTTRNFVIATAGHVDHGKSALVQALTGTDPDRLPEEKARKITIDLGFAELNLIGADADNFHVGIIDVPGHEDFVRNMIAGVGSIDLALFVVAADDGWMPQTEEHLQILTYLGIERAVVALTKADLGHVEKTTAEIRAQLRDTAFAQAPIVATSARSGAGSWWRRYRRWRPAWGAGRGTLTPCRAGCRAPSRRRRERTPRPQRGARPDRASPRFGPTSVMIA